MFKPRPDDIIFATPAKCGTTWVCQGSGRAACSPACRCAVQIVHSLRTGGDLSFDEINLVAPYIEEAHDYGITDLDQPQLTLPRAFKTHFWHEHCPKGSKVIVVVREPLDVGPSFYHFLNGWMFDEGSVSLEHFLTDFWLSRGVPASPLQEASMWHFLTSWYPRRCDPDVLWLHFEDLVADLPACVAIVAGFMGLAGQPGLQEVAVQASLESMKKHASKYDDHVLKMACNEHAGRPKLAGLGQGSTGKVREGKVGSNAQQLSPQMRAAIQHKWEEVVLPVTGSASYQELRAAINKELGRSFA